MRDGNRETEEPVGAQRRDRFRGERGVAIDASRAWREYTVRDSCRAGREALLLIVQPIHLEASFTT
jgi:hypothetical protein